MNKQTLEITSLIDGIMQNRLKNELNANDEELKTLENLLKIKKNSLKNNNNKMNSFEPSVIIKDFLYHGDLAHAIDINLLINLNINNIINLCDCPLDKSINEIFNVLWINNLEDDLNGNLIDYIDKTNQFINESKLKNEKVLVHCQAGISRSSSIILAYLIRYNNMNLEKAYQYLIERRSIVAPNYGFFIQLIRYEKKIKNSMYYSSNINN